MTLASSSFAHYFSFISHCLLFSSSINLSFKESPLLYSLALFLKFNKNYLVSSFYRSFASYSILAIAYSLAKTSRTISLSASFSYILVTRFYSFMFSLFTAISSIYFDKFYLMNLIVIFCIILKNLLMSFLLPQPFFSKHSLFFSYLFEFLLFLLFIDLLLNRYDFIPFNLFYSSLLELLLLKSLFLLYVSRVQLRVYHFLLEFLKNSYLHIDFQASSAFRSFACFYRRLLIVH